MCYIFYIGYFLYIVNLPKHGCLLSIFCPFTCMGLTMYLHVHVYTHFYKCNINTNPQTSIVFRLSTINLLSVWLFLGY